MSDKPKVDMTDTRDMGLVRQREKAWLARKGPRVGDYALMWGTEFRRFTHNHGPHGLQPSAGPHLGPMSFYMHKDGHAEYSGALDPCISLDRMKDMGEIMPGEFWMFHHDEAKAHNGVSFELPCRVYEIEPEPKEVWVNKADGHLRRIWNTNLEIQDIEITDEWRRIDPWDFANNLAEERQLEQRNGVKGGYRRW